MASRMQIGWAAQWTERAHKGGSLVSDLQLFLGIVGNKDLWHSVQRKRNTWQQVKLHVRLSG
jgi:hypothetical protein